MNEVEVWAAIGTLIVMVIGLIITIIKIRFDIKKSDENLKTLAEMINIYRRQVELLNKEISEKISLEREKLQEIQ